MSLEDAISCHRPFLAAALLGRYRVTCNTLSRDPSYPHHFPRSAWAHYLTLAKEKSPTICLVAMLDYAVPPKEGAEILGLDAANLAARGAAHCLGLPGRCVVQLVQPNTRDVAGQQQP